MATPSLNNSLSKTGYKAINLPTKTPGQMNLYNQLQSGVGGGGLDQLLAQLKGLAGGGNDEMWSQLEAPAMRQFQQLQGNIGARFSGLGSGAQRSSAFQNAQTAGASDLAERLQSQRLGLQQGAQDRLMQLVQSLLGQQLGENALIPKKKSGWETFLEGLGGVAGQAAGQFGGIGSAKWLGII
jgi:hypothetical protein